jgi:hypothetical protein
MLRRKAQPKIRTLDRDLEPVKSPGLFGVRVPSTLTRYDHRVLRIKPCLQRSRDLPLGAQRCLLSVSCTSSVSSMAFLLHHRQLSFTLVSDSLEYAAIIYRANILLVIVSIGSKPTDLLTCFIPSSSDRLQAKA